jgi:hypothetical protein
MADWGWVVPVERVETVGTERVTAASVVATAGLEAKIEMADRAAATPGRVPVVTKTGGWDILV